MVPIPAEPDRSILRFTLWPNGRNMRNTIIIEDKVAGLQMISKRSVCPLYQMAQSFPLVRLHIDGAAIKHNSTLSKLFGLFLQSSQK